MLAICTGCHQALKIAVKHKDFTSLAHANCGGNITPVRSRTVNGITTYLADGKEFYYNVNASFFTPKHK